MRLKIQFIAQAGIAGLLALQAYAAEPESAPAAFRFEAVSENSLGVWANGKPVLVYNHGPIGPYEDDANLSAPRPKKAMAFM